MKNTIPPNIDICTSWLSCIYDFQTLIAALIALLSAATVGWLAWRAAKLPVVAEDSRVKDEMERRRQFFCKLLSHEFIRIAESAKQAEGTIKAVISANSNVTDVIRERTIIVEPPFLEDWQAMSLLSQQILQEVLDVRAVLSRHNFDMQRAGGSFGSNSFQEKVSIQVIELADSAQQISAYLQIEAQKQPSNSK